MSESFQFEKEKKNFIKYAFGYRFVPILFQILIDWFS